MSSQKTCSSTRAWSPCCATSHCARLLELLLASAITSTLVTSAQQFTWHRKSVWFGLWACDLMSACLNYSKLMPWLWCFRSTSSNPTTYLPTLTQLELRCWNCAAATKLLRKKTSKPKKLFVEPAADRCVDDQQSTKQCVAFCLRFAYVLLTFCLCSRNVCSKQVAQLRSALPDKPMANLLRSLLAANPQERSTCRQALENNPMMLRKFGAPLKHVLNFKALHVRCLLKKIGCVSCALCALCALCWLTLGYNLVITWLWLDFDFRGNMKLEATGKTSWAQSSCTVLCNLVFPTSRPCRPPLLTTSQLTRLVFCCFWQCCWHARWKLDSTVFVLVVG